MTALIFTLLLAQNLTNDKAIVEGQVLNALTNEPLRKVSVTLGAKKNYSGVSSAEGKFRFEGLEPDSYQPRAQRQGFLDADDEPSLEVAAGQHVKDVVIKLMPQGIIAGHVVDEDGDPVSGAMVRAERSVQVNGRKVSFGSSEEITNSEGYFFIGELTAGRYHLSATPGGDHRLASEGPRQDLVYTELPLPLDLAPGAASRDVEIRLRKSAVFRVRGRVSNEPSGSLSLHLASETAGYGGTIHADGTFVFESVEPGSFTLSISNRSFYRQPTLFCRVPVTVSDRDIDGLVAELTPGASIEGIIKMDGGRRFEQPPYLQLMGTFPPSSTTAKDDGTFGWSNLEPKKYFLDYGPPKDFYVKAIQLNRQPVTGMMLDLSSGAGGTLEIVVAPNAATVAVTVEGGKRALVAIWRDSKMETVHTEPDGIATFGQLAPGEYRIAAWEKVDSEYLNIPEFRDRFDAQKIKVAEGSHENVQVKPIPKSSSDAEVAKLQ